MKYIIGVCIIACCVLAVASSVVFADGCGMEKCNFGAGHGKMSHKMEIDKIFFYKASLILKNASELGLSAEQIEKIKALKYGIEKNSIKEEADIKSVALDIKEALWKDNIDSNAVNKLIDQKYALKAQKAKEAIGAYVTLKGILTPEQLGKLKEMHRGSMKGCHKALGERKEGMEEKYQMHEEAAE